MDGRVVEHEVVRNVNVFMVVYIMIFATSMFVLAFDNLDLITNFTAVAATFNNIFPGLELVGSTANFDLFSDVGKYVLIFDMLAGRLEIFRCCWCSFRIRGGSSKIREGVCQHGDARKRNWQEDARKPIALSAATWAGQL